LLSVLHEVDLPDGDRLAVLESTPQGWQGRQPTAVLVHGLAGCAEASYMVRVSRRLLGRGIRVVRVNLRGAGAGFGLARGVYHAGRSSDLRDVLSWLGRRDAGSPIGLVGFSLGATLVLRLAVEAAREPVGDLDCVVAANPPLDLKACARELKRPDNRLYEWNFVRWLRANIERLHERFPELGSHGIEGVRSVYEFDDRYTAPRNGFLSADDYYEQCSLVEMLARVQVPGLIVHAMDDPVVPFEPLLRASRPQDLSLDLLEHGGHLGYLSRRPWLGDHRWLDSRLETWLSLRWASLLAV
jgi:predicted alpha/beta-fold hydrolase